MSFSAVNGNRTTCQIEFTAVGVSTILYVVLTTVTYGDISRAAASLYKAVVVTCEVELITQSKACAEVSTISILITDKGDILRVEALYT